MHAKINIRPANSEDIKNVFDLSNDYTVWVMSINPKKNRMEYPCNWFDDALNQLIITHIFSSHCAKSDGKMYYAA